MKNFIIIILIFLSPIFFGQENDSIFVYLTGNPYEEIHPDKYTEEQLLEHIHLGVFGRSAGKGRHYTTYFGMPYRKGNAEIVNPIIIKDRSYLSLIKDKWIDKEWIDSISIKEYVDYFENLRGKEIYVISQYYLDKFPDEVLVFKVINYGVRIPRD